MRKRWLGNGVILSGFLGAAISFTIFWSMARPKTFANAPLVASARCDFVYARLWLAHMSVIDNLDRATADVETIAPRGLDIKRLDLDSRYVRFVMVDQRKILIFEYAGQLSRYSADEIEAFFHLSPRKIGRRTEFEIECDSDIATIIFSEGLPTTFRIVSTYID